MVETLIAEKQKAEIKVLEEAATTFNNLLTGYEKNRVGSVQLLECLREVVSVTGIYGEDKSKALSRNASRIKDAAHEKEDVPLAREMSTLIDFATAVKEVSGDIKEDKNRFDESSHTSMQLVDGYEHMRVGSAAVKKALIHTIVTGIREVRNFDEVLDTAHTAARAKQDVIFTRECRILEDFAPLFYKNQQREKAGK